jgi:hypothetical protein
MIEPKDVSGPLDCLAHHSRRQLAEEDRPDRERIETLAMELQLALVERG